MQYIFRIICNVATKISYFHVFDNKRNERDINYIFSKWINLTDLRQLYKKGDFILEKIAVELTRDIFLVLALLL